MAKNEQRLFLADNRQRSFDEKRFSAILAVPARLRATFYFYTLHG
jgi:hypothetical protein